MLLRFLGFIFSSVALGLIAMGIIIFGIFAVYGRDLPDYEQLKSYTPPTISRVYSGSGEIMDEFAHERRLYTPIDEIPQLVQQAFVSAEDKNFWSHHGYDIEGIGAAVKDAALSAGKNMRGGSTITQQVMKNFLLSNDRTAERKVKEIILATRVEKALTKQQILGLYLNEIFLGQNSYGVTAAARTYFAKDLEDLTPAEAAYLAALPKEPSNLHPVRDQARAIERRNYVLGRLADDEFLTKEVAEAEMKKPLWSVQAGDYASADSKLPPRNYFTDEIRRQLSNKFGEDEFFSGGLSVRATMDPDLQDLAETSLRRALENYDRSIGLLRAPPAKIDTDKLDSEVKWRAALAEAKIARDIDNWYPAVVLAVGNTSIQIGIQGVDEDADGHFIPHSDFSWGRPVGEDGKLKPNNKPSDVFEVGDVIYVRKVTKGGQFVRWTYRQVPRVQGGFMAMDANSGRVLAMQGGFSYEDSVFNRATQALRQPGSAFKPFVYATALDNGFSPVTIVEDAPITVNTPQGLWQPKNASKTFYGPTPLRTGIEFSRNLMTVRLAKEVGMNKVAEYAERFGVYEDMPEILSYSLGAGETTLYKMVAAYAMFANGGERVEPTLVDRVQDRYGKTLYRHDQRQCEGCDALNGQVAEPTIVANRERIMDAVTAYQLTSMMRGVVERGTASKTVNIGVTVAGKTGTTNDAKDVWFVGFTPNVVAGCYIGYDKPRSLGRSASGGGMCGPVFNEFMREIARRQGDVEFDVPPNTVFLKFDRKTGQRLPNDASGPDVVSELFRVGEEPDVGFVGVTLDGGLKAGVKYDIYGQKQTQEKKTKEQPKVRKTATGKKVKVAPKASSGLLSSGGLY